MTGESVLKGQLVVKQDVITLGHFLWNGYIVKEGTFNQVNGITTVPHNFGAPAEYAISLTPMVVNGKVGEFWS